MVILSNKTNQKIDSLPHKNKSTVTYLQTYNTKLNIRFPLFLHVHHVKNYFTILYSTHVQERERKNTLPPVNCMVVFFAYANNRITCFLYGVSRRENLGDLYYHCTVGGYTVIKSAKLIKKGKVRGKGRWVIIKREYTHGLNCRGKKS